MKTKDATNSEITPSFIIGSVSAIAALALAIFQPQNEGLLSVLITIMLIARWKQYVQPMFQVFSEIEVEIE